MYGPVRYSPPMPFSNVSCARGVSMLIASGLTALSWQKICLSQDTESTHLASFTAGSQRPSGDLLK